MKREVYIVIESLNIRMRECLDNSCEPERKEFHQGMMRLEARRLLELLGDEENDLQQEKLKDSIRNFTKTATSIFEVLRTEVKFADEIYKRTKGKRK